MERKIFSHRGFTLIELAIVLCVSAVIAGSLVPSFVKSAHIEAARKTAAEMALLKEAAQHYLLKNGAWPEDLEALRVSGNIDEGWAGKNPFGDLYVVTPEVDTLVLSTKVPTTMGDVVTGTLPMSVQDNGDVSLRVTSSVEGSSMPVGALLAWLSVDIPEGWVVCDGRALERVTYPALFALIATTYGAGNGTTTFNVPDLRGRVVVGMDNMGGVSANILSAPWSKIVGGTGGEEQHQLSINELPSHAHTSRITGATFGLGAAAGANASAGSVGNLNTTSVGGGGAHNNVQPSMAVNWLIKT